MHSFSFTDKERESLNELNAISNDTSEREILIGLTLEETSFYIDFTRKYLAGEQNYHHLTRYLSLHDKHEAARLRVLGMAQYLHNIQPPISTAPSNSHREALAP